MYQDMDLVTAENQVSIDTVVEDFKLWSAIGLGIAVAVGVILAVLFVFVKRSKPAKTLPVRVRVPENITPVTVLSYLREVAQIGDWNNSLNAEVKGDIESLTEEHFSNKSVSGADLTELVEKWSLRLS
jgi:hypothetical protein